MEFSVICVDALDSDQLQAYIDDGYSFIRTRYHPEMSEISEIQGDSVFAQFPGIAYVTPIRISAVIAVGKPPELLSI